MKTTTKQQQQPTAAAIEIPDLFRDPAYCQAAEKLAGLASRRDQLRARIDDLEAAVGDTDEDGAEVQALLGRDDAAGQHAELRAAERQLQLLEKAIELQRQEVGTAKIQAERAACRNLLPHHRAIAGDILTAIEALQAALKAEVCFRDQLMRGAVEFRHPLQPVQNQAAGDDHALEAWRTELRTYLTS